MFFFDIGGTSSQLKPPRMTCYFSRMAQLLHNQNFPDSAWPLLSQRLGVPNWGGLFGGKRGVIQENKSCSQWKHCTTACSPDRCRTQVKKPLWIRPISLAKSEDGKWEVAMKLTQTDPPVLCMTLQALALQAILKDSELHYKNAQTRHNFWAHESLPKLKDTLLTPPNVAVTYGHPKTSPVD